MKRVLESPLALGASLLAESRHLMFLMLSSASRSSPPSRRSRAAFRRWLSFTVLAVASLGACSGQGEGALCDKRAGNSGDSDCQSGLSCVLRSNSAFNPSSCPTCYGVCCPTNGTATTSACSMSVTTGGSNGPSGGASDAASSDGAPAATGDAAESAPADATAD